ncbi:MAG: hypothetical protein ACLQF0_05565 [Dissulfurispiraceae bacterium]
MRLNWHTGAVIVVAALVVFISGMRAGAFIEAEGTTIEMRTAIERCETTVVGGFEIIPDKQCCQGRPVNYIYALGSSPSRVVSAR